VGGTSYFGGATTYGNDIKALTGMCIYLDAPTNTCYSYYSSGSNALKIRAPAGKAIDLEDSNGNQFMKIDIQNSLVRITPNADNTAVSTITANKMQLPNSVEVAKNITCNTLTSPSTNYFGSASIGALPMTIKGVSFDNALKLTTPVIYDVYWSSDTWTMWIATGATACGFRVISSGVTP
jgi:hypothetical protein